jgi:hypothetical protein
MEWLANWANANIRQDTIAGAGVLFLLAIIAVLIKKAYGSGSEDNH